ncbi:glycerol-3-phosphate acyltransferase PlsX [Spiroplasma gladiatoris]|uniref:Phosphate acyltransferase n=1 Tax=Spiroplasma gladiatoris TaxID=2143 RepID=A0A4P7AIA6_9MOLU|nr:phosphate acyltransferase PlsX [Spiroplasma gladiatoris]QBQ08007.1 glycerol-3-phosphate acyltransferase PlsX [Spiroplasma gladiatoris]
MNYKKIAFDVMGSDNGLIPAVDAAIKLLGEQKDLKIIFVGKEDLIKNALKNKKYNIEQVDFLDCKEIIEMTDGIIDIRRKKDSSMVKALELVRDGKADAITTGGATAPFIAGCIFIIKRLESIERPAFMPVIPTLIKDKVTLLLDVGANLESDPEDLEKFALMANAYSKSILKVKEPKIALLNIGEEPSKGTEVHKKTYELLKNNSQINFYGNIESRYVTSGFVDVVVTDGYTGNMTLKAAEGMAKNLLFEIKQAITKTLFRKLAALRLKKAFNEVKAKFDYKNHAGAIVLGVDKIAFKSHGSSDVISFYATLKMTYNAIKNDVISNLKTSLNIK